MSLLNTLLKTDNGISFAAPWDVQEPKRGSASGPRWGLCPRPPLYIGSRSTRSPWPRPLLAPPAFKHFQRPWERGRGGRKRKRDRGRKKGREKKGKGEYFTLPIQTFC